MAVVHSNFKWRLFLLNLINLGLLFHFVSCDVYSDNKSFVESESLCSDSNSCSPASSDLLELQINTENNYPIASTVSEFQVGGNCNEGGFSQNIVVWELYLDNVKLGNSQDLGLSSKCDMGRFSVRVRLPKAGLYDNTTPTPIRREHTLVVQLEVYDETGTLVSNALMGKKSITLTPQ